MVASGFSLANTVLPATSTSQPAAYTSAALASVMPPSISITAREPQRSISRRSSATFSVDPSMNDCPPNPGSTLITSTRSSSFR